jgi:hypothetical protein
MLGKNQSFEFLINSEKIGINTPIKTNIGPNVMPKKPKPNGSLSSVITKKPINIVKIPTTKILLLVELSGKLFLLFVDILN